MNILWVINTILPYPAKKMNLNISVYGGWLNSLLSDLEKNNDINKIAIVSMYNGNELKKFVVKKITYYLSPVKNNIVYDKNTDKNMSIILDEFNPDLVHVHGTEYPHSLSTINECIRNNIKTVTSIQGLISLCGNNNVYFANIPLKDILKHISFRDIIRHDSIISQAIKFRKRGIYEIQCIKKTDYVIGRTSWDNANVYAITGKDKYKKCNESLRPSFYDKEWNINDIERNSIFISQASYPIKGFHKVLFAVSILKQKYSDVKVYVAGNDIVKYNCNTFKEKIKLTGYGKYLRNLIKKYDLKENIVFLGLLNEDEMVERLLKSHIFVQASSIENSPNSLGEAMLIGMPCVASYVGGTSDMLKDKEEGFLYPFNEHNMLAKYIDDIFVNDELAISMGKKAHKHAKLTHDRYENVGQIVKIYKEVINEYKK